LAFGRTRPQHTLVGVKQRGLTQHEGFRRKRVRERIKIRTNWPSTGPPERGNRIKTRRERKTKGTIQLRHKRHGSEGYICLVSGLFEKRVGTEEQCRERPKLNESKGGAHPDKVQTGKQGKKQWGLNRVGEKRNLALGRPGTPGTRKGRGGSRCDRLKTIK